MLAFYLVPDALYLVEATVPSGTSGVWGPVCASSRGETAQSVPTNPQEHPLPTLSYANHRTQRARRSQGSPALCQDLRNESNEQLSEVPPTSDAPEITDSMHEN